MKLNGDINLRQRARRKWYVLLAVLVVAGGWWLRNERAEQRRAAMRMPPASAQSSTNAAARTRTSGVGLADSLEGLRLSAPSLQLEEQPDLDGLDLSADGTAIPLTTTGGVGGVPIAPEPVLEAGVVPKAPPTIAPQLPKVNVR